MVLYQRVGVRSGDVLNSRANGVREWVRLSHPSKRTDTILPNQESS